MGAVADLKRRRSPMPSLRFALLPQHSTLSLHTAQLRPKTGCQSAHGSIKRGYRPCAIGALRAALSPTPRWPYLLCPQHHTLAAPAAQRWGEPTATPTIFLSFRPQRSSSPAPTAKLVIARGSRAIARGPYSIPRRASTIACGRHAFRLKASCDSQRVFSERVLG